MSELPFHPRLFDERSRAMEALGDALRRSGDLVGAVRAYLDAGQAVDAMGWPLAHPGLRFWLRALSLKTAEVVDALGHWELGGHHRRLAQLELTALLEPEPLRPLRALDAARARTGRFRHVLDPETGLLNREGLERVLRRQAADAALPHCVWGLLLLEVANHRAIVDAVGADAFAALRRETTRRLLAALQGPALLTRWASEALAVLLVAPSAGALHAVARYVMCRTWRAIRGLVRSSPSGPSVRVRLAWGYACTRRLAGGSETLTKEAERRLAQRREG